MKKINVEISGVTPLLMNNPASMLTKKEVSVTTTKVDFKEEARGKLYINSKGKLYVPSSAIKGTLINAAAYKKFGKYSAKPLIAGGVLLVGDEIELNTQDWEIDLRTVVLQRKSRIPCARPKIKDWKLSFTLMYNEKMISSGELIKPLLEEAGERVGLLDFRPQKLGNFGMFKITKWKEE